MSGQKSDFKHMDKTVLGGRIMSIQSFPNVSFIRLAVTAGGIKSYPAVTVYDKSLMEGLSVRDIVRIDGRMRMRSFKGDDGKTVFQNLFVADKITKRYRALNEFLDIDETRNTNGAVPDDINSSLIVGEVRHVYMPESRHGTLALVSVRVKDEDGTTSKELSCFQRNARVAATLVPGDIIAACGMVTAAGRPSQDGVTAQNIACKDMEILWKNGAEGSKTEKEEVPSRHPAEKDESAPTSVSPAAPEPEPDGRPGPESTDSLKEQMIKDLLG